MIKRLLVSVIKSPITLSVVTWKSTFWLVQNANFGVRQVIKGGIWSLPRIPGAVYNDTISALKWFWDKRSDLWPYLTVVAVKVLFYAPNLTLFPYYENDEATYAVRALSFLRSGEFDMYTYWYDHAPGGWMFMSVWYAITGQSDILGSALNSGRLFIFLLTTASALLVYYITNRLVKDRWIALTAATIFMLSPLSVYYQRRILLDNIMSFWTLLSLAFMIQKPLQMKHVVGGSLSFAMAVMTKLNAVFFAPAMLFALLMHVPKELRRMSLAVFAGLSGMVMALFPLYALLKGELFSKNPNPATGKFDNGISLIDSLTYQSSRGTDTGLNFWDEGSNFRDSFAEWAEKDPLLIGLSLTVLLGLCLVFIRRTRTEFSGLITIILVQAGIIAFFIRGGVVLEFYFMPMVPVVAIISSIGLFYMLKMISWSWVQTAVRFSIFSVLLFWQFNAVDNHAQFWRQENTNLELAVEWVEENIDKEAYVVSDNYAVLLLNFNGEHKNLHYNFKYEYDDDVNDLIADDWRNAEYILLTHELLKQVQVGRTPFVREMLDHAEVVASFDRGTTSFIDLDKYISTNGDWVKILKIKQDNQIVRQQAWEGFRRDSFKDYGRIVDQDGITKSQYQSNALVRALQDDRRTDFDGIWQWTKDHLQNRGRDRLISSEWSANEEGEFSVSDSNNDALADIEFAYALSNAAEKWATPYYQTQADELLADYWQYDLDIINGRLYPLVPGAEVADVSQVVNPSYAALPYFSYFSGLEDSPYDWNRLVEDSYYLISSVQDQSTGLFPNWVTINSDGSVSGAESYGGEVADVYGYEAFRIPIWLGLMADKGDNRAAELLQPYGEFMASQQLDTGIIPATIALDGSVASDFDDTVTYASAYYGIRQVNEGQAKDLIETLVMGGSFIDDEGVWRGISINNQLWLPIIAHHSNGLELSKPIPAVTAGL